MTSGRKPLLVAKPERNTRLDRVHVLVVNSSEKAGNLIRGMFQQLGFSHVVTAHTAANAIFTMKQLRVDMIVVDDQLYATQEAESVEPEWESLRGVDFIRRLRYSQHSPNRFAPAIMLVDQFTERDMQRARDAGVNEIVLKPLVAKDFCDRVTAIFDKPRNFVTAPDYKGPCRRRRSQMPEGQEDRRKHEVRLIRCDELKDVRWDRV